MRRIHFTIAALFQHILKVYLSSMNWKDKNHTPPAPAATAGAIRTLAFLKISTASGVQGMFEPRNKIRTTIMVI